MKNILTVLGFSAIVGAMLLHYLEMQKTPTTKAVCFVEWMGILPQEEVTYREATDSTFYISPTPNSKEPLAISYTYTIDKETFLNHFLENKYLNGSVGKCAVKPNEVVIGTDQTFLRGQILKCRRNFGEHYYLVGEEKTKMDTISIKAFLALFEELDK